MNQETINELEKLREFFHERKKSHEDSSKKACRNGLHSIAATFDTRADEAKNAIKLIDLMLPKEGV